MPAFGRWMAGDWAARGRPDVVHAHFWMSGLAALEAASGTAIPVVQTFHALGTVKRRHQGAADTSPPQRLGLRAGSWPRGVDLVIATCSDEVRELAGMGAPADRVTVVPCGVDTEQFAPATARPRSAPDPATAAARRRAAGRAQGLRHGHLGAGLRAGGRAGHRRRPAAEELDRDPEARRLQDVAAGLGVADRVRLLGQVPHERMPALFRSADVVLCTPWYEPFGIMPLEAAACGVPVVGSAVGGLLDTVEDAGTGLLVPPRDPAAVADAVTTILDDPSLAGRWGERARRRAVERYDWASVAAATEECLEGLSGSRTPVRAGAPGEDSRREGPTTASAATAARRVDDAAAWLAEHRTQLDDGMRALAARADLVESWGAADGDRALRWRPAARGGQRWQRGRGAAPHRRAGRPVPRGPGGVLGARAVRGDLQPHGDPQRLRARGGLRPPGGGPRPPRRHPPSPSPPAAEAQTSWPRPSGRTTTASRCGRSPAPSPNPLAGTADEVLAVPAGPYRCRPGGAPGGGARPLRRHGPRPGGRGGAGQAQVTA